MTSAAALETPARKRNAEATREAILDAAKAHFARSGYEGALLREIAADAGVDAALINRYFGGKEGLFAAVLTRTISSRKLFEGDRGKLGKRLAELFAAKSAPASDERMQGFRLILRAATTTATAGPLNKAVHDRFMDPIAEWMGGEQPDVRARLFSALFMGLLVEGLIRDEPLADAERDAFISRLGAIFQSLVDE